MMIEESESGIEIVEIRHDTGHLDQTYFRVKDGKGNVTIHAFGGLHKYEWAAIEIAKHNPEVTPEEAVSRAEQVLKHCKERVLLQGKVRSHSMEH